MPPLAVVSRHSNNLYVVLDLQIRESVGLIERGTPVATRRRRTLWKPGCSRAMAMCSQRRTPVRQRPSENSRSCHNGCAGVANGSISGSRNGTGWTRALGLPSASPPGGILPGSTRNSHGWTRRTRPCCSSVSLRLQATRYRSVLGVGSLTAALPMAFRPAGGQQDRQALTAQVGLAPWSRDRGHKRGEQSIRDGQACTTHCTWRPCP